MNPKTCHIDPAFEPLFKANGLTSFDTLMHAPVGRLMSAPRERRRLYRLELQTPEGGSRGFYLKRMADEPLLPLLKSLVSGRLPHCGPLRELQLLQDLETAGFAVMTPVAWGEERRFGVPRCGFLLVAEVRGQDVASLVASLPMRQRQPLLEDIGRLIGSLHAAGFFHPVRLKDLILEEGSERLVLIDRETGKPWSGRFSPGKALAALARTARRTLRDGHRFGPASIRALLAGYHVGVAARWAVGPADLRRRLMRQLRLEMRPRGGHR